MDSKIKISKVFNQNPQGSRLRGRPKPDGWTVYKHALIDAKLQTGKGGQKQSWLGEVQ